MAIRSIVFDIGNVLADYRWYGFLKDKGFSPERIDRIARSSVLHPAWGEYDRGVLPAQEVIEGFIRNDPEIAGDFHRAFDSLRGLLRPRDYAVRLVSALKNAGYGVFYLSNFSQKAAEDCPEALSFLPYTDGGVFSYLVKLLKPDPAIYRLLLERYGLRAEESVFLDDMTENVAGARSVGMRGIVFSTLTQALGELEGMGVCPDGFSG